MANCGVALDGKVRLEVSPQKIDVPETEPDFMGNALLKARAYAKALGAYALADDSGLCVDALGGMPGVLSARWSGRHATDQRNVSLLLEQLSDVPIERRAAKFVCAVALVAPDGRELCDEGFMHGRIGFVPVGTHGFGYDPIFVPDGFERTSAELSDDEKDAISHRGNAIRALADRGAFNFEVES